MRNCVAEVNYANGVIYLHLSARRLRYLSSAGPIRFAVSMETRGKTYRFSLWSRLKERTPRFLPAFSRTSFTFFPSFFAFLFMRVFALPSTAQKFSRYLSSGSDSWKPQDCSFERRNSHVPQTIQELYFANKTGLWRACYWNNKESPPVEKRKTSQRSTLP